ncbi:MAG: hypothetical protein OIF40_07275 [Mangrovicoccus sp.]|nr:hypothetical protein [Mangrovicoccus sp.]
MRALALTAITALGAPLPVLAQSSPLPEVLTGHGGPIKSITLADDGRRALTASFDYSLILWDLSAQPARILHRLLGHDGAVNDVAFLPPPGGAVSVGDDGQVILWDLEKGSPKTVIPGAPVKMLDIAISPDGRWAASSAWDNSARLYDLQNLAEIARLPHRAPVNAVAFSADGARLFTAAGNGEITEWDRASAQQIRPLYRHGWGINSIALIAPDRLAFGGLDGSFGILSLASNQVTQLAKSERPIQSVKTSPDGALMGYGDGAGQVAVFASGSGVLLERGTVTYGPVWDFAFLPNSPYIYHVGLDDFAALWRISPRDFGPIEAELPRRFQIRDSEDPGELEFLRKCSICHTLTPDDGNRAGPTLYDLFGRRAGSLPGYPYSPALAALDVTWNAASLSQLFDDGPDIMVPGTKMPIQRLKQVDRRDDLIRFLETATAPVD